MKPSHRAAAALLLAGLTPSCALLSKSDPVVPRYFSPEMTAAKAVDGPATPSGLELRLGRVSAEAYVKSKVARRESTYEVVYYEGRLWTERPDAYVRRALVRAIFGDRGVRQVLSGVATTLEVEVLAFEEVVKPVHVGRVTLAYSLYDDRTVLLSRSVTFEHPIDHASGEAEADAIVEALAGAMGAAVDAVAAATTTELRAEAAATAAGAAHGLSQNICPAATYAPTGVASGDHATSARSTKAAPD
jgi:cholesterol transport system auxiliary component